MFRDEYTESRTYKWKFRLIKLAPELTGGDEVVDKLIKALDVDLSFWKAIKENPESQINNEQLKDNLRFLEFTCGALQRVIEIGQRSNEELRDAIGKTQLNESLISRLEEYIKITKNNLSNDLVQRRQNRFALIELKIKDIQANTPSVDTSMVDSTNRLTGYELSLQVLTFIKIKYSREFKLFVQAFSSVCQSNDTR
jgi:hypothetical protein